MAYLLKIHKIECDDYMYELSSKKDKESKKLFADIAKLSDNMTHFLMTRWLERCKFRFVLAFF